MLPFITPTYQLVNSKGTVDAIRQKFSLPKHYPYGLDHDPSSYLTNVYKGISFPVISGQW